MAAVDLITKDDLAPLFEELRAVRRELADLRSDRRAEARLVSMDEAARLLGVSKRTVQRMVAAGQVPSTGVRAARRVDVSALLPGKE